MPTAYPHRLTIIVPAARRDGLNAWLGANLGDDWANTFSVELVPLVGPDDAAPTHYWASFAATEAQGKALMGRLAAQAGTSVPPDWDSYTEQMKKDWIDARRVAVRTAIGVDVSGSFNDGVWNLPQTGLTALGLKVRKPRPFP